MSCPAPGEPADGATTTGPEPTLMGKLFENCLPWKKRKTSLRGSVSGFNRPSMPRKRRSLSARINALGGAEIDPTAVAKRKLV